MALVEKPSEAGVVLSGNGISSAVVLRLFGKEVEQVVPREHRDRLAVVDDEEGVRCAERLARLRHGFVHTDQTERGPNKFLNRIRHARRATEDELNERSLVDCSDDFADDDGWLSGQHRQLRY